MKLVIARGQEELFRRACSVEALGLDLELVDFVVKERTVVVRYRCGDAITVLRLASSVEGDPRRLEVSKVRTTSESVARALKRHVDSRLSGACILWTERNTGDSWKNRSTTGPAERHIDVQELAFRAGVKPAMRKTLAAEQLAALIGRLEGAGAIIEVAGEVCFDAEPLVVVCVGSDRRRTRALCGAERELLAAPTEVAAQRVAFLHREVGALLGYPRCCVDAFVSRVSMDLQQPPGEQRWTLPFEAARRARARTNLSRLNNLLLGEGRGFISFEPCRYDCEGALAVADATAAAVDDVDRASRVAMDEALEVSVVLDPSGVRARVGVAEGRIVRVTAVPRARGGPTAQEQEFAASLGGTRVHRLEDQGRLLLAFKSRTDA